MMRFTLELVGFFVLALVTVFFVMYQGNKAGDQQTIKDCRAKGEAIMAGGGKIKCTVVEG